MLKIDAPAFLAISPSQGKRVLVEGKVVSIDNCNCVIAFDQVSAVPVGSDVTLFADVRGRFFQQAAKVTAESVEMNMAMISFETIGEPVSAEQRGSFRTSTMLLDHPIQVARIAGCTLADVSPEGLGVITPKPLAMGEMVDVTLQVDGMVVKDRLKVQGSKILPNGKLRFGLMSPSKSSPCRPILQKIAGHFQRAQLRRLSGAA